MFHNYGIYRFIFLFFVFNEVILAFGQSSIRVGYDINYPPFEYRDKDGNPAGFDIEITKAVAKEMGLTPIFIGGKWEDINQKLLSHQIDVLAGAYMNPGRDTLYEFSAPYKIISHGIFFRKDSKIQNLGDIKDAHHCKALLMRHIVLMEYLWNINSAIEFIFMPNATECLTMLSEGQGDIAIVPEDVGNYIIQTLELKNISSSHITIIPREYGFAARKGDTLLIHNLNKGLSNIQRSGVYNKIVDKYFETRRTKERLIKILYLIISITLILAFILGFYYVWNFQLKRQIAKKTVELNRELQEKEQAKRELQIAKEKAEESDRLKSAFLANMSHEIRTPLNAIMGFSEMMHDPDSSEEERNKYYELVNLNSQILLALINDIIDISKIESGQLELNYEWINVKQLVNHLYNNFLNELKLRQKEHIKLELSVYPRDELKMYVDGYRLSQIITNLVINAIKFTFQGFISYGYEAKEKEVTFFVADSGVGIEKDKQNIIFERFRQADDGLSRRYEGAGLGLAISKNLVEMMGGRIWVESVVEKGSIFYFTLPLKGEKI